MKKENSLSHELPHASFCNITATFSGIGNVILDVNSAIISAIDRYSLNLEQCPFQTIYLHFQYLVQNLKRYQLKDIVFFYEWTGDPYFDLAISMLDNGSFISLSKIDDSLESSRIALALCCRRRENLFDFLTSAGLYVGLIEMLLFEIPFVFTLVFNPQDLIDPHPIYKCAYNCTLLDMEMKPCDGLSSFDQVKASMDFFDFNETWHYEIRDFKIDQKLVKTVLQLNNSREDKIYFDGRILEGMRRSGMVISDDRGTLDLPVHRPWSGKDLDLIMPEIPERISMKHLSNIRRSAMSLYNGKFHFSTIVRETAKKPTKMGGKMLKIIRENEERLQKEKDQADKAWLKSFYATYVKIGSLKGKRAMLEKIRINNDFINRSLLLLRIELYGDIWNMEMRNEQIDERVLVSLYLACLEYIEKHVDSQNYAKEEAEFVFQKLIDARFEATAHELLDRLGIKLDLSFSPDSTSKPNDLDLYFQLKYVGDHLKRTLGTRKDKRVPFDPDLWQAHLLDAVDAGKSAIVAAPTSSGKTFICFYAIEKILKGSDTDMVVFCLPTKALVNQVSADIYARFNLKSSKTSLQGTLMADRCTEPFNCQVLITIPGMLESLLNSKDCSNIKYIIIDEVHKINDRHLGLKIERIIHLARCPLLLLSATLGNLEGFYGWFKGVENSKGRECELVYHSERYCELKTYVYTERPADTEKDFPSGSALVALNGMFPYSFSHLREFGFGNDLHFLPEELLNLYLYIYMVLDPAHKKLIRHLAPKKFFKSNVICKADIKEYQHHLLGTFRNWVEEGIMNKTQVKEIHNLLTAEAHEAFNFSSSEEYLVEHILKLLNVLKEEDKLPVIVFNTNRDFVTRLARLVYEQLENQDIKKRKDKLLETLKKEAKRTRDQEKTKTSWIDESIAAEQMVEPDQRDIKYTFLDPVTKLTDYEVKEELADVKRVPRDILDMAFRGIGIHHSAMNRKYRSAVEILFRKKHIRVLFATETLALGINMPCRTVVFAGDTLELDPMNYKQMSGRAGRRGYDTLGNVVFFGISKHRVQNLMVSMLPEIQGGYIYSNTSLVSFNIEESIVKRPLLCANRSYAIEKELVASIPEILTDTDPKINKKINQSVVTTLDILETTESRKTLVNLQKTIYPHIFPSNYLWDLYISNRDFDPSIFVFSLLFEANLVSWGQDEFINLLAHLFEVRPVHDTFEHVLQPLPIHIENFISKINGTYLGNLSKFYEPVLQTLQNQTAKPLFYLKSLLYVLPGKKNSYIYDFFQHGSSFKIQKNNHISEGELWLSLNNVETFFKSFIALLDGAYGVQDERLKKVKVMYGEFHKKFEQIFA